MEHILSFPLSYGLSKTGLPLIPIMIGNYALCFIIDTGSTENLIDNKVADYFKCETIGTYNIAGIDGIQQNVKTIRLEFEFEGKAHNPIFCVKPLLGAFKGIEKESELQIHGILGMSFILENKWILDFKDLIIKD